MVAIVGNLHIIGNLDIVGRFHNAWLCQSNWGDKIWLGKDFPGPKLFQLEAHPAYTSSELFTSSLNTL